jgi:hypothetical protein
MQAYPSLPAAVYKLWSPLPAMPLRLHSSAAVGDANNDACRAAISGDEQATLFWHGLERVHDDVQECTLHQILESKDLFQAALQFENDLDALSNRSRRDQLLETFARRPDIKRCRLLSRLGAEDHLNRTIEALHFSRDRIETSRDRLIHRGRCSLKQAGEQRAVDPDDVKHPLEVVDPVTRQKGLRPVSGRLLEKVLRARERSSVAQEQYASFGIHTRNRTRAHADETDARYLDRGLICRAVHGVRLSEGVFQIFQSAFQIGFGVGAQELTRTTVARRNATLGVQHDNTDIAQVKLDCAGTR